MELRDSIQFLGLKNSVLPSVQSLHFNYLTKKQLRKNLPISFRVSSPSYDSDLNLFKYRVSSDLIKSEFMLVHRLDFIKRRFLRKYEDQWTKFQIKTSGGYSFYINNNFTYFINPKVKYREYKRFFFLKNVFLNLLKKRQFFFLEKSRFYNMSILFSKGFFRYYKLLQNSSNLVKSKRKIKSIPKVKKIKTKKSNKNILKKKSKLN
jgi:hypothetical protein